MMWDGYWGMGGWIGIVFMLVILAAIVVAVVALVHYLGAPSDRSRDRTYGQAPPAACPEPAEEILRRRYAAGEIDRDEYLRRLEDLRRPGA
jgi:putative membrane protein